MPKEDNIILKYDCGEKSMKLPFIIYSDLECILKKMRTRRHNTSTTKINKHTPYACSLFTHCSFDTTKNKLDCCKGKSCMERLCKDLKEHATKIINYEKKGNDTTNS